GSVPKRVGRSHIGLERYLEDWIANDITLIAEGLTLVGRQISIDDGRLDLLAIDSQDRWVVIEIKPGVLDSGALTQALYYASSIARLGAGELYEKIEDGLDNFRNSEQLSERVRLLDSQEDEREIDVLLVGAGIHPGLERMNKFLGGFNVPISVVSFEVFELDGGPKLLIREVIEEPAEQAPPGRKLRVETIRSWAADVGVGRQFDRFVKMAENAGLAVQPQRASVRIAPQANRTRFLMYAQPRSGEGGELYIQAGPKPFAEFFDHIDEKEAIDAMGEAADGVYAGGEALDTLLDRIERFLTEKVKQPDRNADS
ncbi:MAG: DUF91 domain-containing protein, partial [Rhodospirillaceae bacterium]|nr:DUF91 domain-containing protein [Rhodospirillaceae bacterium]